ncbi:enoyl-CoA hydratase-related protein [Chthonobacter rhizosphaerae]|uniref:enoyl-CoA hydratase-related protein n=1 Tax=Chthonobacter rhizosphaerae TaxID=2735553 RepID=UPI0015EF6760|nr:enoyl-CoA hydratase-related protein [Chthonobacter rhizosphaerae]
MTEEPHVTVAVADGVATLTLNRPDRANVLSAAMIEALDGAIQAADADPAVRVLVIAAKGRIFSAGHDLAEVRDLPDQAAREALFARCSAMMQRIAACRVPVIAKVQGAAVAAGCQLVATCDLAYAAEGAKFGVSGINLGLFCSTPSVALTRAVAPKQALDLLFTGRLIPAERAAAIGLVSATVPAADLDGAVDEAAGLIARKPPAAVELGKRLVRDQAGLAVADAYDLAGRRMAENMDLAETGRLIDGFLGRS